MTKDVRDLSELGHEQLLASRLWLEHTDMGREHEIEELEERPEARSQKLS
jgi:hypothetical protein